MPNYTNNFLTIYGESDELRYFYERNRVNENDEKFLNMDKSELSFEKCVSREITSVFANYINNNYTLKEGSYMTFFNSMNSKNENKSNVDVWNLMRDIWGTKWDAIDVNVNLSKIDSEKKLSYRFDTAWSSPENWLITISKIFKNLEFEITFSNEDDGHDETYIYKYKDGVKSDIETFSAVSKSIEEFGGIEPIIETMITYCNEENVMLFDDKEKIFWLTYAKKFIEENQTKYDYESELFNDIISEIYTFLDEYELHQSCYRNKDLCKAFVEKVKNM